MRWHSDHAVKGNRHICHTLPLSHDFQGFGWEFCLLFFVVLNGFTLLSRRSRQRERLHAMGVSFCSSVCLSVCLLSNCKIAIFSKVSNVELWSLLTTNRKSYTGIWKNPLLDPLKLKMADLRPWRQSAKMRFSQKVSNLELWCLLTTYRKLYMGFSNNPLLDP